jgi:alanyl-tRNA synthetase
MTERLYYADAYLHSFTAQVTGLGDGRRRVYLDRSAFYPTSGGQPHDTGTIAGVPVADVLDEGDMVAHVLADPLPAAATVPCEIDWDRRYDHMQQHTGQHLLSAVCEDLLGMRTTSVHFGPATSTLDLADEQRSGVPDETLRRIESRANTVVAEARPVVIGFEDATAVTGLRKPSDRSGTLRIVTIDGIDRSACGGTHVRSTSEIGPILLRGAERVRNALRIEFVCGSRALARARRDYELLTRMARAQSAAVDDIAAVVEGQMAQLRDAQAEARRLNEVLADYRARELYESATPDAAGLRRVVERANHGGADRSRALALAVSGRPGVVFVAASHDPPSILLATSADSGIDAGRTLRPLLERAGGRGGGSARLAQGSVPAPSDADAIVRELLGSAR